MSQYVGASAMMETNGGAPTAITVHANTAQGDILLWYHYSAVTTGNETVTPPSGFTSICNFVTANQGLVAAAWRERQAGDTTYTATITNHTSSVSGETVVEWIESWADVNRTSPISSAVTSLSTWASSTNVGSISATGLSAIPPRGTLIVFGGRRENITGQTVLTGDNLSWTTSMLANSSLGLDAGAITQRGINNTTSNQTATAKTVTTTGTAQAGAGVMFVLSAPPVGTVGGIYPESNNCIGPFADGNGNLYTITEIAETPPNPAMRKSVDGGDTWLEVNSANRPTSQDFESLWMIQRDTVLHALHQRSGSMIVYYHTFNTSDASTSPDTWQTRDEIVHTPVSAPANQACALVVKANGDLYAFYRSDPVSSFQRLAYRKKPSGGAWSAETQIDTTASTNFTQIQAVLGTDGATIHIFYKNDTGSNMLWKKLSGSDVLDTSPVTLNTNATGTDDETAASPPAVLNISGTERLFFTWKRASNSFLVGAKIDGGSASAEESVSHVAVYEDPPLVISEQSVAALAVDSSTSKIYVVYADNATHDLWYRVRNGTWNTETEILDGVEAQVVQAQVFTHSGGNGGAKVLGIVYDDALGLGRGVPRYTEVVLAAGGSTDLVVQNVAQGQTTSTIPLQIPLIVQNVAQGQTSSSTVVSLNLVVANVAQGQTSSSTVVSLNLVVANVAQGQISTTIPLQIPLLVQGVAQGQTSTTITFGTTRTTSDWSATASATTQASASITLIVQAVAQAQGTTSPIISKNLVIQGVAQAQSVDQINLNIPLLVQSVAQGQSTTSPAISKNLAVANVAQGQTSSSMVVSLNLVVVNVAQGQTTTSPVISKNLVVANVAQGQISTTIPLQIPLLVQNVTQGQTSPTLTLGMPGALIVSGMAQGQTTTTITLVQVHVLTVQSVAQGQSTTSPVISKNLAVTNVAQGQTTTVPTISSNLVIASVAQGQVTSQINLNIPLLVQNVAQGQTSTTLNLSGAAQLTVQNVAQGQTTTTPLLAQVHVLTVASVAQGQSTTTPLLAQVHVLTIASVAQGQASTTILLSGTGQLGVQNVAQGQTSTSMVLAQVHVLVVQAVTQTQSATTIPITKQSALVVQSVAQGQTSTTITLSGTGILGVQPMAQGQTSTNLNLTQVHILQIQNVAQAQSLPQVGITKQSQLVVQSMAQAQSVPNVVILRIFVLGVANVAQAQNVGQVLLGFGLIVQAVAQAQATSTLNLAQLHKLVVQAIAQPQFLDHLVLSTGAMPFVRVGSGGVISRHGSGQVIGGNGQVVGRHGSGQVLPQGSGKVK